MQLLMGTKTTYTMGARYLVKYMMCINIKEKTMELLCLNLILTLTHWPAQSVYMHAITIRISHAPTREYI